MKMFKGVAAFVAGVLVGVAVSVGAEVSIDRSRMTLMRGQVKTLALKLKNDNANVTQADRDNLAIRLAYIVLGED